MSTTLDRVKSTDLLRDYVPRLAGELQKIDGQAWNTSDEGNDYAPLLRRADGLTICFSCPTYDNPKLISAHPARSRSAFGNGDQTAATAGFLVRQQSRWWISRAMM